MNQTPKQQLRQPFGFFMENLLARTFFESGIIVYSYKFSRENYDEKYDVILNNIDKQVEKNNLYNIDLIRWENNEIIISEIKSKYGPNIDEPRIYFTKLQLEKFLILSNAGKNVTIFIMFALDTPRFVEIPFNEFKIPNFENKREDRITLRIPLNYRDTSKYVKLPAHFYNYQDLDSLINLLKRLYNKK
ncbi:MAG: hypothetical protein K0A89_09200 [ANME-2 cluster archaeon]|nr:hypothetical protein [ANME-2 cluster archaeon]